MSNLTLSQMIFTSMIQHKHPQNYFQNLISTIQAEFSKHVLFCFKLIKTPCDIQARHKTHKITPENHQRYASRAYILITSIYAPLAVRTYNVYMCRQLLRGKSKIAVILTLFYLFSENNVKIVSDG